VENGEVTDGSIEFMGERIDGRDPEEIVRMGIFQVMEGRCVFENLTVHENLIAATCTAASEAKSASAMTWCSTTFRR